MLDYAAKVTRLVGLAHSYLPPAEQETQGVGYIKRGMRNPVSQWHLLTANSFTTANAVAAIKEYLAVGGSDWPRCKIVHEELSSLQLDENV